MKKLFDFVKSSWSSIVCYGVIVVSSLFVVLPSIRDAAWAKIVVSSMIFAMLAVSIHRGSRSGEMSLTVRQIYSQAKGGRRFVQSGIEVAAMLIAIVAFWLAI